MGSDDIPFRFAGIPTVFFFDNNRTHYHSPNDDADSIDSEGLHNIATLTARLVRNLATKETLSATQSR